MKTYYYIYKITILTGRLKDHYYIGQHMTDNLDDGYTGSGRKIKNWFKYKDRIEGVDYIKEIICFCNSWEEMQEKEDFYLGDKWKDEYPECLNLVKGGNQHYCSEETRKLQSVSHLGQIPWHKGQTGMYSEQALKNISEGTSKGVKEWIKNNPEAHNRSIVAWGEGSKKWRDENPDKVRENMIKAGAWTKNDKEKRERANKKTSETNNGMKLMTDGSCKPFFVIKEKQQKYIDNHYYYCHKDGSPYIEYVKPTEEELHIIKSEAARRAQTGSRYMTDGKEKPKKIQKQYIESKQLEGWYFCYKDGTPLTKNPHNVKKNKIFTSEKNKHISDVQNNSILMTKPGDKVRYVIPEKQPEFINNGYYRCHRNGTHWEEKVA